MGDLSENFSRYEFRCHHCSLVGVDIELIPVLEDLRAWAGDIVHIISGFRCAEWNASPSVGGGRLSFHLTGRAADIKAAGKTPNQVQKYLLRKYPDKYGIGMYNTFTHIDVRSTKGRWDERS